MRSGENLPCLHFLIQLFTGKKPGGAEPILHAKEAPIVRRCPHYFLSLREVATLSLEQSLSTQYCAATQVGVVGTTGLMHLPELPLGNVAFLCYVYLPKARIFVRQKVLKAMLWPGSVPSRFRHTVSSRSGGVSDLARMSLRRSRDDKNRF